MPIRVTFSDGRHFDADNWSEEVYVITAFAMNRRRLWKFENSYRKLMVVQPGDRIAARASKHGPSARGTVYRLARLPQVPR